MDMPLDTSLPLFVYGALKPGMPAYGQISGYVATHTHETAKGGLYVRDGLPLLHVEQAHSETNGTLLRWHPGKEREAYRIVCGFEPRKHYKWSALSISPDIEANVLVDRHPAKGNPQPLESNEWNLRDDPAFGPGLEIVQAVLMDLNDEPNVERRFFRAQMAYLLLWSILERLSTLSIGPNIEPTKRAIGLHSLPGMVDLLLRHVDREDKVTDSRDPAKCYSLKKQNPKKCFEYYYQVRSNLSHRGKAVFNEFDKVFYSLKELASITDGYLRSLRERESSP
jgi:hypothetical protein